MNNYFILKLISMITLQLNAKVSCESITGQEKSEMCGPLSWSYYEEGEKCFKLLNPNSTQMHDTVSIFCVEQDITSVLPSIECAQDEEFIINLIEKSLNEGSSLKNNQTNLLLTLPVEKAFANSTSGQINSTNVRKCLQMTVGTNHINGNRVNVVRDWNYVDNCHKINLVVCQKAANWAPSKLLRNFLADRKGSRDNFRKTESKLMNISSIIQKELIEKSKQVDDLRSELNWTKIEIVGMNSKLNDVMSQIDILKNAMNLIPIGFIYVQYYSQSSPSVLWPTFVWTDRTSLYAGQFFRAFGGNSAAFGVTQSENFPRITTVQYEDNENHPRSINLPVGGKSDSVHSGFWMRNGDKVGLAFTTSAGEVRPYNSAIKIWQRTG